MSPHSQMVWGPPLSSGLEPPRKAQHGCSGGDPVASHTSRAALVPWTMPSPGQTYMARRKTQATCKVFSLTIFLLCKNKGRTLQVIWGKMGASMAPPAQVHHPVCRTRCFPHPQQAICSMPCGISCSLGPRLFGTQLGSASAAEWLPWIGSRISAPWTHGDGDGDGSLSTCQFSSLGQSSEKGQPARWGFPGPGPGAAPGWKAPSGACSFPPADVLISPSLIASIFTNKTKDFGPLFSSCISFCELPIPCLFSFIYTYLHDLIAL